MLEQYDYKIIKCGDITEIYCYKDMQWKKTGDDKKTVAMVDDALDTLVEKKKKLSVSKKDDKDFKRMPISIQRTKKKLQRLIDANIGQYKEQDKFLTLTFKDNEDGSQLTRKQVFDKFRYFRERMTRHYGKFEYVAVLEKGTTGSKRLHLHVVVFGLKYVTQKRLQEIWKYGIVDVRKIYEIDTATTGVADYMTKYIQKTLDEKTIGKGERFYLSSLGLIKPQEIYITEDEIDMYNEYFQGIMIHDMVFNNSFIGDCAYRKYKRIKSFEEKMDMLDY